MTRIVSGEVGDRGTWRCEGRGCKGDRKGCKITVETASLRLVYPHTCSMHKCAHFAEAAAEERHVSEDYEDGLGLGLFD